MRKWIYLNNRSRILEPGKLLSCFIKEGVSLRMSRASFNTVSLSFQSFLSTVKYFDLGFDSWHVRHCAKWVNIAVFLEGSKCWPINHCVVVIPMHDMPSSQGQEYWYTSFGLNKTGTLIFSLKYAPTFKFEYTILTSTPNLSWIKGIWKEAWCFNSWQVWRWGQGGVFNF